MNQDPAPGLPGQGAVRQGAATPTRLTIGRVIGGRATPMALAWVLSTLLVASFEMAQDPLMAWERLLGILFSLLIPALALASTLALHRQFASAQATNALAARHGSDRRRGFALAAAGSIARALLLTMAALILGRYFCRPATEAVFRSDLVLCCGIGCLATSAYIAYFQAATRLGIGRAGAWAAFVVDLTLGHVSAGLSMLSPHRFVQNLIEYPAVFSVTPRASSWILLGFVAVGLTYAIARTPR